MKLILFIGIVLITEAAFSQTDSIARVKKPVLSYLIGEHYRAEELQKRVSDLLAGISELKHQLDLSSQIIGSLRQDSIQADSLLQLEKATGGSWKRSYELEKIAHSATKRKLIFSKATTIFVVVAGVVIIIVGGQ